MENEHEWKNAVNKRYMEGVTRKSLVSKSPMSNKGSFTKPRSLTSFTRPTHNCERLTADLEDMSTANNNNNIFIDIFVLFSIKTNKQINTLLTHTL